MEKNRIILAILATSLLLGPVSAGALSGRQSMVAQEQSKPEQSQASGVAKSERISRLKKEWREFWEALRCVRQKGYRECTPAQKRKIKQAAVVLLGTILVIGGTMYGIKRGVSWRQRVLTEREEKKAAEAQMEQKILKEEQKRGATERLVRAVNLDNVEFAEQAIKNGADVNAVDSDGKTPLHTAAFWGKSDIVGLLITNSADVNAKDNGGATPLHTAAFGGKCDAIALLLEAGAKVNAKDNWGATPLHKAASWGYRDAIVLLLEAGAEVNAQSSFGKTPLHEAVLHSNIVRTLLDRGADPRITNHSGETPLENARQMGNRNIVKILDQWERDHPAR